MRGKQTLAALCLIGAVVLFAACGGTGNTGDDAATEPVVTEEPAQVVVMTVDVTPEPPPEATALPTPTPEPTRSPEPTGKALTAYKLQLAERAYFESNPPAGGDIDAELEKLKLDADKPMLALTFDDGPSSNNTTTRILDVLEANNARATFFVIGQQVEEQQEVVGRAIRLNCEIASHTWGHGDFADRPAQELIGSLTKVDEVMQRLFHYHMRLYRPTKASISSSVKEGAKQMGYPMILWSGSTHDWSNKNAKLIRKHCLACAQDGAVILFHDLRTPTADAAEVIIPELIEQGYQLVTVSELMFFADTPTAPGESFSGLVPNAAVEEE